MLAAMKSAACAAFLLVSACQKPQPPQLVPREVTLTALTPTAASFVVKLAATNPNSFALSANSFRAHLVFDGGKIDAGTVDVTQPFSLAPGAVTELAVPVSLDYAGLTALGVLAAQKPSVPFAIDGTVNVGGENLNVNLPYAVSGAVTQAQIASAAMKGLSALPGLPPNLGGLLAAVVLAAVQAGDRLGHRRRRDALVLQLLPHSQRAQPWRALVKHRLHHPRLADEILGGQVVQRRGQRAGFVLVLPELALQLGTRVLALAQQAQRTAFERRGRERHLL